jgi:hypothetical protein
MRYVLILLLMLFGSVTSAMAQVSIGIGLPGVSIGINLPVYPELVPVPGYPVYYAPRMNSNYFFYDGMYWVYQGDNWYASSWYNGPWGLVGPEAVPLFVLRIPVNYYRNPPVYFRGWRADAPPRWGEHWGHEWEQRRSGWDRWNRSSAPRPAPLPVYQRQYSGDRYPRAEQQQALHSQNYRYQPRDAVVRQHYQQQAAQRAPASAQPATPQTRSPRPQDTQRSNLPPPVQQSTPAAPRGQTPQRTGESVQRPSPVQGPQQREGQTLQKSAPTQAPPQQRAPAVQEQSRQPQQGPVQREQQTPRPRQENIPQGSGATQEPKRTQEQAKDHGKGDERGQEKGQERNR